MDLKDKIVGLALAALIALVGWNLKEWKSLNDLNLIFNLM